MSRYWVKCVAAAVLFGSAAVGAYYGINWVADRGVLRPRLDRADGFPRLAAGARVEGPTLRFEQAAWSLLLITSPSCSVCQASRDFHKAAVMAAAGKRMLVYIVLPYGTSSTYMGLPDACPHIDIRFGDLRVTAQGTPTIVLVDRTGIARRIWVGGLSDRQGREVLAAIGGLM
jgi:hypothetical protein